MNGNLRYQENLTVDFSVSHIVNHNGGMDSFHIHDDFEIYYTMTDGVSYFVNDKIFRLEKGDLLIFNHQDLHRSTAPKSIPYERFVVVFHPEYIKELSSPQTNLLEYFTNRNADFCHRIHLTEEKQTFFLALLKKAQHYCDSEAYGADIYKRLCLAEILLTVNELFHSSGAHDTEAQKENYGRMKPVVNYIHDHLNEPITLDFLSKTFYLSRYHLGYLFKKETGFSVHEYIIQRRIMQARLLLKKNCSVSQVCEMVGFNNEAHFIRAFKKLSGISPKQYALKN